MRIDVKQKHIMASLGDRWGASEIERAIAEQYGLKATVGIKWCWWVSEGKYYFARLPRRARRLAHAVSTRAWRALPCSFNLNVQHGRPRFCRIRTEYDYRYHPCVHSPKRPQNKRVCYAWATLHNDLRGGNS